MSIDRCWGELRAQVLDHCERVHAAGRAIPEISFDLESLDEQTMCIVARLSDGVTFTAAFDPLEAAIASDRLPAGVGPELAATLQQLRASENIARVDVLAANQARAYVRVTPLAPAVVAGDWATPSEPYVMRVDAIASVGDRRVAN